MAILYNIWVGSCFIFKGISGTEDIFVGILNGILWVLDFPLSEIRLELGISGP